MFGISLFIEMRSKFFKQTINRKEGDVVLIGQAKKKKNDVRPFQGMR